MTTVEELQVIELLNRLPDQALLKTSEAAVFLRSSVRTLERLRQAGAGGPAYIQSGAVGTTGVNQKCLYRKKDLTEWIEANRVSDNVEAAIRKGQLFRTLADVLEERPFWTDASGRVGGLVYESDVDLLIERVTKPSNWQIEWLPAADAIAREWTSLDNHQRMAEALDGVVSSFRGVMRAAVERTELSAG